MNQCGINVNDAQYILGMDISIQYLEISSII